MRGMEWWWWWVIAGVLVGLGYYLVWLAARVGRLHRRAESATAALDAALVRRAAAAALLADGLAAAEPRLAVELAVATRAALDASPVEREAAENDLTLLLRRLSGRWAPVTGPGPGAGGDALPGAGGDALPDPGSSWAGVVTASRRVGLARQVHTDLVRDARAVRRRVPVRLLGLARRFEEPVYFDVGDPGLDGAAVRTGDRTRL